MTNHSKFNRIEGKLKEVEDEILSKVDDLELKINAMKDQILRITRLIDQDNKEKENFIKQTDTDINDLEEKVVNYFQEEKQIIRKTIDERYLECENKIKALLDESKDNKEDLKNKLILISEQVEVIQSMLISLRHKYFFLLSSYFCINHSRLNCLICSGTLKLKTRKEIKWLKFS